MNFRYAILCGLALGMLGCPSARPPVPATPHVILHPVPEGDLPKPVQDLDGQIADLKGQLVTKEKERANAMLAPLRAMLLWTEVVLGLLSVLGVVVAVASQIWGLGFAKRVPLGIAAASAAGLLACYTLSNALDHVALIVGLTLTGIGLFVTWFVAQHLALLAAARKAWDAVPETEDLGQKAEDLLGKIERKVTPK